MRWSGAEGESRRARNHLRSQVPPEPGVVRKTPGQSLLAARDAASCSGDAVSKTAIPSLERETSRGFLSVDGSEPVENAAVQILSWAAVSIAASCAVGVLSAGPSREFHLALWIVALIIGLPMGMFLGARQNRRLRNTPQPITRWALAIGTALLLVGLVALRALGMGRVQLLALGLIAVSAYGAIELAARFPTVFSRLEVLPAWTPILIGAGAVVIIVALFVCNAVPRWARVVVGPGQPFRSVLLVLVVASVAVLVLAAVALSAVLVLDRQIARTRYRLLLDVAICVVLAMVVFQVKLPMPVENFVHHQDFYLGPLNDMAHGRTILVEHWAAYGVGVYYALLIALSVVPLHHGGFVLVLSTLMAGLYVVVYATLRTAVRSQALVVTAVLAAVMANVFAMQDSYAVYPSVGPLRFGLPYLIVAFAVAAARWPKNAQAMRGSQLIVIAIAAVWSFETFVYTSFTWFAITAMFAFGPPAAGLRIFLRQVIFAAASAGSAVCAMTVGTRIAAGEWPDWSGYFAYIFMFTVGEFGTIPLDFWSPALLMAAAILLSAVGVLLLARKDTDQVSQAVLTGLVGFTALAWSTFTYFLGEPFPNALLVLFIPLCALGCLWASVFLGYAVQRDRGWRAVPLAVALLVAATVIVFSSPFAAQKWQLSAFGQLMRPSGGVGYALRSSFEDLWAGRTYDNQMVDEGATLLQRFDPGDGPALVVIPQGLNRMSVTTEILLRVRRVNLLPISNPEQDTLIMSRLWLRIITVLHNLPEGTILLTSTFVPPNSPPIMKRVLEELQRHFVFQVLAAGPSGAEAVLLHPRR